MSGYTWCVIGGTRKRFCIVHAVFLLVFANSKACGHRATIFKWCTILVCSAVSNLCICSTEKATDIHCDSHVCMVYQYKIHLSTHLHAYTCISLYLLFIMHVLNTQSLITKNKMFILSGSCLGNCGNCLQLGQYLLDFGGTFNFRQER